MRTTSDATRRGFLRTSTCAAAGGALGARLAPGAASRSGGADLLRVGLVGCGGRGTGAAVNALKADAHVELAAMADLFEDRLEASLAQLRKAVPGKVNVPRDRCFLGFDAYRKLMATDVDVVLLATPPGFRPAHLRAAVEAGKHTFVEITIAVDAPGVRSAIESAELATRKNLAIVSGFCWRHHAGMRAAAERIRGGAIGEVRAIYATYYRGSLGHKQHGARPAGMRDLEWQLRDWYGHLWLSGDVTILLSGGHSTDKMSWWLDDRLPLKAVAVGGRTHPGEGGTFDNCFVAYEYPGGVHGFLGCRTIDGCHTENADRIIGATGVCTIFAGRAPVIAGANEWRYDGVMNDMYQAEHDALFASIRAGRPINDGVRMAHTTLVALMGRMAAYTGQEITWEAALHSQERVTPDHVDWDTRLDPRPLAVPGVTRFL